MVEFLKKTFGQGKRGSHRILKYIYIEKLSQDEHEDNFIMAISYVINLYNNVSMDERNIIFTGKLQNDTTLSQTSKFNVNTIMELLHNCTYFQLNNDCYQQK